MIIPNKQRSILSNYSAHQVNDNSEHHSLRTHDGKDLNDKHDIYRYFAKNAKSGYPLYGKSDQDTAAIDTWINFGKTDIDPHAQVLAEPGDTTAEKIYEHVEAVKTAFTTLDKHLLTNFFLATNRVSLADISVAFAIYPLFTKVFDTGFRKQYSNLVRWFETVVHQPKFLRVIGDTTLSTKSTLPPPPKKEAPKKQAKKKDGGDGDDDKEPELEEAGKKLDLMYLSNLPPSKFNLEAWKTKYANTNPTRPEAINWFWENYDPTGWCLYFYNYKWPEECKIDFMTANKFGGFLQRAEAVKNLSKFTMTSQVTLKKDDLFRIWGVWLFRGTEMPPEFRDVDDTDYYDWHKADVTVEADREFVNDCWSWESHTHWGGRGEFYTGRTWGC
jgi:elongation factor 1-gamma